MNLLNEKDICMFCMSEMEDDQIFCCDTYKGRISKKDFVELYGELDD